MEHSQHSTLREYLFEVANALLTLPRAVGSPTGNPTLLQLENMEEGEILNLREEFWQG